MRDHQTLAKLKIFVYAQVSLKSKKKGRNAFLNIVLKVSDGGRKSVRSFFRPAVFAEVKHAIQPRLFSFLGLRIFGKLAS